jgi:ATP-dependent Clp protease ATP-binding subunit ClpC
VRGISAAVWRVGAGLAALAWANRRCDPVALFERFTERARQVVVLAQEEATGFKHGHIGTEHILLGLVRDREGLAAEVLESFDITLERVRGEVVRTVGVGNEAVVGQVPFTPNAKKVLELALREALTLGHHYIGTEHILLGLLATDDAPSARILRDFNADPEKIRSEVIRRIATPPSPAEPGPPPKSPVRLSAFAEGFRIGPDAGARRLLMVAAARALDDGRSEIESRDVLLALTRDETLGPVLADLGVREAEVLRALERRRPPEAPPRASAEG